MRKIIQIIGSGFIFLFGLVWTAIERGWHALDIIGRGDVASNLPHIFEKFQGFIVSQQSIGYQILPWALMFGSLCSLALLQWPALWPSGKKRPQDVAPSEPSPVEFVKPEFEVAPVYDWPIRDMLKYMAPHLPPKYEGNEWKAIGLKARDLFSTEQIIAYAREQRRNSEGQGITAMQPVSVAIWRHPSTDFHNWVLQDDGTAESTHDLGPITGLTTSSFHNLRVNRSLARATLRAHGYGTLISLKEGATRAYEQLKGTTWGLAAERLHANGTNTTKAEGILQYMATGLEQKGLPIYGKEPPSRQLYEINRQEFKRGIFIEEATKFKYHGANDAKYFDLQVNDGELAKVIETMKSDFND